MIISIPFWTLVGYAFFRFRCARGERKISHFIDFIITKLVLFCFSSTPRKSIKHLPDMTQKSSENPYRIDSRDAKNRILGSRGEDYASRSPWNQIRAQGSPGGARKTRPIDDQDGGQIVQKSIEKFIISSMLFGRLLGRTFLDIQVHVAAQKSRFFFITFSKYLRNQLLKTRAKL